MLSGLAPARRRFVLAVGALVLLGAVAVGLPALLGREPVRPVSQDAQPPVLLVPGYGGSVAALEILAESLEQAGRDATIMTPLDDATGDLRAQAEALGEAAERVADEAGATSVDVVGYSAGGVVTRLWVRELEGGGLARRVVTLGSPHHGTDAAALGAGLTPDTCPEACRQLAPDSDLLRGLNAGDETPPGPLWISIWTTQDRVVVPADSATLEGALEIPLQTVCPGVAVSHGELPRVAPVLAIVAAVLGREAPRAPAAEVCSAG